MPIDFHAKRNARTYVGREAHSSWTTAMTALVNPEGLDVVDVGCGGGIYSQQWARLGASSVVALDWSESILESARDAVGDDPRISFRIGTADATGLPDASCDLVFARALVHHLDDLAGFMREAARILRTGGWLIVQDRTMEDVAEPGNRTNPRGYFFEVHPQLLRVEQGRRPETQVVLGAMTGAGFNATDVFSLHETRRHYEEREEYLEEIRNRVGRSILHDLDEDQLAELVDRLRQELPETNLTETDRWTVWAGQKA
ncbi:class I SAM-dependent methyltransferase [Micrococcus luteus]|uniref:class I SAM-dependent methyltransferase n=1 Tax=Micrococcus luteus TaxID=1270 RepID=UPI000C7C4AB7|nr:class I SAM-dependent methyltransferase [Micrococcus luteus]MDK7329730.1 class I SAM-dependent methyltransferase [Micrococcus luteus]PLA41719.1 SAM-dependent methyltransferase [Micrococcus luteus]